MVTPKSLVIGDKIYVVGHPLDTACHCEVQIYDPALNIWSIPATNGMRTHRDYFAANEINGKIYGMGGGDWDNGNSEDSNSEVFDPATNT